MFCTREALDAAGGWDESVFASEEVILARAIKRWAKQNRCAGFCVIRTPVLTSGRKLREFSGWEVLRLCLNSAMSGGGILRSREKLDIWYGPRTRGG